MVGSLQLCEKGSKATKAAQSGQVRDPRVGLSPTIPRGSEAHISAIQGNIHEPKSDYTTCGAVVWPEGALKHCIRP